MKHLLFLVFITLISFCSILKAEVAKKSECLLDLCVGDSVYAVWGKTEHGTALATIAGIDQDRYILLFESGIYKGQYGSKWTRERLALLQGCVQKLIEICVNEKIVKISNPDDAFVGTVVGIQGINKDKLVIELDKKDKEKEVYGNYELNKTIYKLNGKSGKFSSGDLAINKADNSTKIKIVGLNNEKQYFVKILDGDQANEFAFEVNESDLFLLEHSENDFSKSTFNLDQINENLRLPIGAQIILKDKLYVPANRGCGAPLESNQDTQCFICQANKVPNSTLYEVGEGILEVTQPVLNPEQKEISIKILDSEDLNRIVCRSKTGRTVAIKSFETLQKALNDSGIYFKDPAPVVKTFGKVKSE